jgi:hypothetical protein
MTRLTAEEISGAIFKAPPVVELAVGMVTLKGWETKTKDGWPMTDEEEFAYGKMTSRQGKARYYIAVNPTRQLANPLEGDKPHDYVETTDRTYRVYCLFLQSHNLNIYECACRSRGPFLIRKPKDNR